MSTAIILGAGFSRCAGLPTQSEFSKFLLSPKFSQAPLEKAITEVISEFIRDVFGWSSGKPFPSLEDYFTCLDLSANSGHHLGIQYTPKRLRAIRRMTIYRIFQILDHKYRVSSEIENFLKIIFMRETPSFIVLNWDIVLEKTAYLQSLRDKIYYGFECYDWHTKDRKNSEQEDILISKINGSSNWVYCENCTSIFYDLDKKIALHEMIGLIKADFRLFKEEFSNTNFDRALGTLFKSRKCHFCNNMLATHIVTFSFKKSYRTFAYPAIWHNAQSILSKSSDWIFVGYSLPDADFEFKHMLKVSELTLRRKRVQPPLKINVVVKNDRAAEDRFRSFFGSRITKIYQGGLQEFVKKNRKSPQKIGSFL